MKKDSILYVVVFTFIICAVFVSVLSLANQLTKDRVAQNRRFAVQAAVLDALGIAYTDPADAEQRFSRQVSQVSNRAGQPILPAAYRAQVDGQELLVTEYTGPGVWGGITIMLASDPATSRIRGIQVVDQNETPGLGGRITEAWFLNQFRNLATRDGAISVQGGAESSGLGDRDSENALADGITGATRTSDSFGPIVNGALRRIRAIADGSALETNGSTNRTGGK